MTRLSSTFKQLQQQGRRALIPYLTAGYPVANQTPDLMHAMVKSGADIIELGIPFSDPMADGPVIQKASEKAISQGVGLKDVLLMVAQFRQHNTSTPVVLMGYANPIERYEQLNGKGRFALDAAQAGVDGLLIVDYPPEECESFVQTLKSHGIDLIFLLAPTTTEERMAHIARLASAYVYYVSLKGVTGAGHLDTDSVKAAIPRIRRYFSIPIGVGFGIADAPTARAVGEHADAVIIGSRLIQLLEGQSGATAQQILASFLTDVRQSLDTLPPLHGG